MHVALSPRVPNRTYIVSVIPLRECVMMVVCFGAEEVTAHQMTIVVGVSYPWLEPQR